MPRSHRLLLSAFVVLLTSLAPAASAVATDSQTKFIWPTTGRITQPYGCTGFVWEPRRGSCAHFHNGIDIADAKGTPIRAAADGVLSLVGWDPWLRQNPDWMVIISHGKGIQTMYAHLRAKQIPGIRKGLRVRQGQIIGYMDKTGMATGVHLHWSVIDNHTFVNPKLYVKGAPSRRSANPSASGCGQVFVALEAGGVTAAVTEGEGGGTASACSA